MKDTCLLGKLPEHESARITVGDLAQGHNRHVMPHKSIADGFRTG